MFKLIPVLVLAFSPLCVAAAVADETESSAEEFRQFCELLEGRWVGDITLIADWPGQDKREGDKITGYAVYTVFADGNGLEWYDIGGTSTGKTLITFDASTKHIKAFHVGSGGGNWQTIIWKKSDTQWGWKLTGGSIVDGRKFGGEGNWVFENDGQTHVIEGSVTLDGEPLPELRDIYTRVDK